MTDIKKLIEEAIETLEWAYAWAMEPTDDQKELVTQLKHALADLERCEPVGWIHRRADRVSRRWYTDFWLEEPAHVANPTPVYTHPVPPTPTKTNLW